MKILTTTRLSGLTFRQVFDMVLEDLQLLNDILDDERVRVSSAESSDLSEEDAGIEEIENLEQIIDGVYERMSELEGAIAQ